MRLLLIIALLISGCVTTQSTDEIINTTKTIEFVLFSSDEAKCRAWDAFYPDPCPDDVAFWVPQYGQLWLPYKILPSGRRVLNPEITTHEIEEILKPMFDPHWWEREYVKK